MNVQQQTIVALGPAYAGKRGGGVIAGYHELHLLDTGAIAILDEENNLLQTTTVLADLAKVQKFYFAQGGVDQASSPKLSMMIDRTAYTQWYNTYEAPTLQSMRIGKVASNGSLNLPTLVNGQKAQINVADRPAIGYTPNMMKRYAIDVTSVDTATTICTRLAALINADPNAIVTATILNDATNDYIQLTAKNVGTSFSIGTDEILYNATKVTVTNNFTGFGTLAKVKAAVQEDKLTRGDEYRLYARNVPDGSGYNSYVEVTDGLSGSTFNGWTFQWKEEANRAADNIQTSNPVVSLFILTTATGLANINTILGVVLGTPDAGAGGSGSGKSSGEGVTVDDIPAGGVG